MSNRGDWASRRAWFEQYKANSGSGILQPAQNSVDYTCPCCGYPTLGERGGYEIYGICNWEDDGQDNPRADETWGGPNRDYSLAEAGLNFAVHQTMYRESDRIRFERDTAQIRMRKKRELMAEMESSRQGGLG